MQQLIENTAINKDQQGKGCWSSIDKNLSFDDTYIYWKKSVIEFVNVNTDSFIDYVNELANRCRHLAAIGVPVNIETVVHYNTWFSEMDKDYRYKSLLSNCPDIRVSSHISLIVSCNNRVAEYYGGQWDYYIKRKDQTQSEWNFLWGYEALQNRGYTGLPLSYSDLDGIDTLLRYFYVPTDLLNESNFIDSGS